MLLTSWPYFLLAAIALLRKTAGFAPGGDDEGRSGIVGRFMDRHRTSLRGPEDTPQSATGPDHTPRNFGINQEGRLPQVPIVHSPPPACTNPSVRKEWRALTYDEKAAWIRAVNCLSKLPGSGRLIPTGKPTNNPLYVMPLINKSASWYDDLSYAHLDLNSHTHQTGLFFPWHRYFLWSFEQTLKEHCGYTGSSPYWDWTKDSHNFVNASIWDSDVKVGLGGFGDPANDHSVADGGFSKMMLAYPTPHTIRRQYTPYPYLHLSPPLYTNHSVNAASTFTPQEVQKVVSRFRGDFKGFQTYFESAEGMHMSVHFIMGGDLSGTCPKIPFWACAMDGTPNEPLFWLHHSMVDKVWSDWQNAHPENYWAFEGGTVRDLATWPMYPTGRPPAMTPDFHLPTDNILIGNYTVRDVFNTTDGPLCYTYE